MNLPSLVRVKWSLPRISMKNGKNASRTGAAALSLESNLVQSESFAPLLHLLKDQKLATTTSRLLNYLYRTQKRSLDHLQPVLAYETSQYMKIDYYSKRNLELTETIRSKGKKAHYYGCLMKQKQPWAEGC